MDLSRVCKDEDLRQELIKLQKGDGYYNPHTGVYKYGELGCYAHNLCNTHSPFGSSILYICSIILKPPQKR